MRGVFCHAVMGTVARAGRCLAAWRALALAVVVGVVAALTGVSPAAAAAPVAAYHPLRHAGHPGAGGRMSLAQAPAGLRAAVRQTLGSPAAGPITTSPKAELTASDGAGGDQFGYSVAISGTTAVVGAPAHNADAGAAYVFTRSGSTWTDVKELSASGSVDFGSSVAISGSTVVVGAEDTNSDAGAAYVFTGSGATLSLQATLADPADVANDDFGDSVAVSGSTVVVGAYGTNHDLGAAYVFTGSGATWSEQAKLTGSGGARFGDSVAISGPTVVVGAMWTNSDDGAAYVFTVADTVWSQQAELTDPGKTDGDFFGDSVAISGSTVVVGAWGTNSDAGAAYVYTGSGADWSQPTALADPGNTANDSFGYSVAVAGSTAVVGADGTNSFAGAGYEFTGSGSTWSQSAELTASGSGDFGWSVAISGTTAVIGAYGTNSQTGAAYVFGAPPSQQASLAGNTEGNLFGYSVAISGSTAVVGAYGTSSYAGAAYVYVHSGGTWSQQAELTASGSADFGYSVAISGSTVVVGADVNTSSAGKAYVFTRSGTTWSQQAALSDPVGAAGDYFGSSVAISGSAVVVGAFGTKSDTGKAYVFARSGTKWSKVAGLADPASTAGDYFGYSVAISGSTAVIGAYGTGSTGAAYLYAQSATTGAWHKQATLSDPGSAGGDSFGGSVAISGTTAVIGASGTNSDTGAAYVYTRLGTKWSQKATLTASDGAAGDYFGSVAISGSTVVVGALGNNSDAGAAYAFTRSDGTWSQAAELTDPGNTADDLFGGPVAITKSTAVIGAPLSNAHTGKAYVFANV